MRVYPQDDYDWAATMAAICATVTAAVQTAAGVYATFQINLILKAQGATLKDANAEDIDQEVDT